MTVPPPSLTPREELTLRFLAEHEAPCPACGYNVYKSPLPRCAECGRALTLRLATPDSRAPASWLLLMIVSSLSAGMGAFILAVTISERIPQELSWRIVLIYFICTIPLPLFAYFLRRPMSRYRALAWNVSLVATVITVAMVLWFLIRIVER